MAADGVDNDDVMATGGAAIYAVGTMVALLASGLVVRAAVSTVRRARQLASDENAEPIK